MPNQARTRRPEGWRFWRLVILIAAIHWVAFVGAEEATIAAGELPKPASHVTGFTFVTWTLGTPLMHLFRLPPSAFGSIRWWGDDTIFVFTLAGLNSLVWGVALVSTWRWWITKSGPSSATR
jgi:hypothetical protein